MTTTDYSASVRAQFGVLGSWHRSLITLDLRSGLLKVAGRKLDLRGADVTHSRRGTSVMTHAGRRTQIVTLVPLGARGGWRAFARALTLAALSPPGYRVLARLGDGGSGRVYSAVVDDRERASVGGLAKVALKLVPRALTDDVAAEVTMARNVPSSSHVISPVRVFLTKVHLVSVMELLEGGNLLEMAHKEVDGLPLFRVRSLVRQLLEGVDSLHELGVAHRDIKLENILLDIDGTLRLCDLGLAEKVPRNGFVRAVGTVYTQAPEVGEGRYATPADMWSVGVVLLVLLLRAVPFSPSNRNAVIAKMRRVASLGGDPLSAIIGTRRMSVLPKSLLDLLRRLLNLDPEARLSAKQALEHEWFQEKDLSLRPLSFGALIDVKVRLRRLVEQMRERTACEDGTASVARSEDSEEKMLSIDTLIDIKVRLRRIVTEMRERHANSGEHALTSTPSSHAIRQASCRTANGASVHGRSPNLRVMCMRLMRSSWRTCFPKRMRSRQKRQSRLHHAAQHTEQPT